MGCSFFALWHVKRDLKYIKRAISSEITRFMARQKGLDMHFLPKGEKI